MTRQKVLELAESCTDNGKVDVIKLATQLGIDVYAIDSDDQNYNAQITYDKDEAKFSILVNENHPETRRRFSIAHEVGHFVLDEDELRKKGSLDRSDSYQDGSHREQEKAADKLAAEILMPQARVNEYVVEQEFDKNGFTVDAIKDMAAYFHVSKAMAITRLRSMDYTIPYLTFA